VELATRIMEDINHSMIRCFQNIHFNLWLLVDNSTFTLQIKNSEQLAKGLVAVIKGNSIAFKA
jgi:hypothetical protein